MVFTKALRSSPYTWLHALANIEKPLQENSYFLMIINIGKRD